MGLFLRKNHLRCWGGLSLLNEIGALTLSLLLKLPPRKHEPLCRSMKFLSPEVVLCLYKSTICSCMEYCCHVWAGAPYCYLDLLDKLQKQIRRSVGSSLSISFEPLARCRNIAIFSLFVGITLLDVHLNWLG